MVNVTTTLSSNLSNRHSSTIGHIISTLSDGSTKLTANELEHHISLKFFFILTVVGFCILVIHLLITTKIHYLPESIAIVFVGALIGLFLKMIGNWRQEEEFPPMIFFLVFLPPIIFESGYNLHKGNFFQNIGSILVFAIIGTTISAIVIGGGLYLCGIANLAYKLTIFESFGFGSLISAVDPVATLAIFKAMDVDPILYMLVFGESILNDAVSIVLMTTIMNLDQPEAQNQSALRLLGQGIGSFLGNFLASAAIGIVFGLVSALVLKWLDLRKTPSLEVGMMLVFSYAPYCLCEGIKLSGIMAILFAGIVMSHYTHKNLSPVSQMTVQQIFRTLSFISETIVFAYLGLAIFSFKHRPEPAFISWVIVLCLVGRAANIFPLSFILNYFRDIKITRKNQFVMWFSGLRGAIAFALALHLDKVSETTQQVLVTTALIVVLFTIICLGGLTLPVIKLINWCTKCMDDDEEEQPADPESSSDEDTVYLTENKCKVPRSRKKLLNKADSINGSVEPLLSNSGNFIKRRKIHNRRLSRNMSQMPHNPTDLFISKTKEMGDAVDSEMSGFYDTEAEYYVGSSKTNQSRGKNKINRKKKSLSRTSTTNNFGDNCFEMDTQERLPDDIRVAPSLRGFMRLDAKYLFPFFTRIHTQKDVQEAHRSMTNITEQWSRGVRTTDATPRLVIHKPDSSGTSTSKPLQQCDNINSNSASTSSAINNNDNSTIIMNNSSDADTDL